MKQKMIMASGYLLAGMLSCSVLVAAAKCSDGGCPEQAAVVTAQPTTDAKSVALGEATKQQPQTTGRKRRRTRKSAAVQAVGDDQAVASGETHAVQPQTTGRKRRRTRKSAAVQAVGDD